MACARVGGEMARYVPPHKLLLVAFGDLNAALPEFRDFLWQLTTGSLISLAPSVPSTGDSD